ncbi:hypothetical protein IAU59_006712 [Kwoniella sp. CBS 9459]
MDNPYSPSNSIAYPLSYPIDAISDAQLDPSLFALAAQVQAVAHACAQGIDIDIDIDPSIAELAAISTQQPDGFHDSNQVQNGYGLSMPLDPALLEIAAVVDDVNKGKIRLDEPSSFGVNQHDALHSQHQPQVQGGSLHNQQQTVPGAEDLNLSVHSHQQADTEGIQLDDGIDPTLREIVNSLTNAQQSTHAVSNSLSQAQAVATIGAHLSDAEERERLQRSLQSTIEDFTQANFNSLFPSNFPNSPNQAFLSLNPESMPDHPQMPQAGPSSIPMSHAQVDTGSSDAIHNPALDHSDHSLHTLENPLKRGRGRPKGSKNKSKPKPPPRPPKRVLGPPKPKGRPPKIRPPDEQADYELRKQEKALGIKRQKGRPRKFPGYLVREMRLKKNREEFNQLLRGYDDKQSGDDGEDSIGNVEPTHDTDQGQDHRMIDVADIDPAVHGLTMDQVMSQHGLQGALDSAAASHNGHNHQHVGQDTHAHDHNHEHEHDFGNWSVQDGQTLLDVVGMGVGGHGGVHHPDSMENVFGLSHHG